MLLSHIVFGQFWAPDFPAAAAGVTFFIIFSLYFFRNKKEILVLNLKSVLKFELNRMEFFLLANTHLTDLSLKVVKLFIFIFSPSRSRIKMAASAHYTKVKKYR